MRKNIFILFMVLLCISIQAQNSFQGKVFDQLTGFPVYNAEVSLKNTTKIVYTDFDGSFNIQVNNWASDSLTTIPTLKFSNSKNQLYWEGDTYLSVYIFDVNGKRVYYKSALNSNIQLSNLTDGIYLCRFEENGNYSSGKLIIVNRQAMVYIEDIPLVEKISKIEATIKSNGFVTTTLELNNSRFIEIPLISDTIGKSNFLYCLTRENMFTMFEGDPLFQTTGNISSIKILYDINADELYYINSKQYNSHYNFAKYELDYKFNLGVFNSINYDINRNREYYLLAINYYQEINKYVIETFAANELTCDDILNIYNRVALTSFFRDSLKFVANASDWQNCNNIPKIDVNELYLNQKYQGLNTGETFGYLRKIDPTGSKNNFFGKHDIVLLKTIPIDLPVVAGIITNEMQTPLSHLNVLSKNRGTPNMSFKNSWENEIFETYKNQLINLKVEIDTFYIRSATLTESQEFWNDNESGEIITLEKQTEYKTITSIENIDILDIPIFGAKASNLGELNKIKDNIGFRIPENAFAIPFYYYEKHISDNNINAEIEELLSDTIYRTNLTKRKGKLELIQQRILDSEIDNSLANQVLEALNSFSEFDKFRFRSSTNAEDIEGFNGAGLYNSYTANAKDMENGIEEAIKKVWASLWNLRAFEERDYFNIDQRSVSMGILVHRSFPDEEANGVVITKNLYTDGISAITINSQFKDISIVDAANGYTPESILFYTFKNNPFNEENIEYLTFSDLVNNGHQKVLETKEVVNLARICFDIKTHYYYNTHPSYPGSWRYYTLDIEFKIDKTIDNKRHIYIKQARPFD